MLKLRHFTISWKISVHFDFDGSSTSQKKLKQLQEKAGKETGANQKQMEEHLTTN